jgi:rfaE bifunctional protein kinase chain/domain
MREQWRELSDIVGRFGGARVAVAGDLVLDRFWYGATQRMSREAPVPIVRVTKTRSLPGCAANTIWNLSALGSIPLPVGVVGTDREGDQILELFRERGVDCGGVVRWPSWETPTKTRILAGTLHGPRQQVARVDSGEDNAFTPELARALRQALERALEGAGALILSDYGYGLADALYEPALPARVPVSALDSRFGMERFPGFSTATPNEEEFENACRVRLSEDEGLLEREGDALRRRLAMEALLVTRGGRGMSLFEEGRPPVHLPVVGADQVVDVTGAGDTVIATYVTALCAGASYLHAAAIANTAGGVVVQRHGPATTTPSEIASTLQQWGEGNL